MGSDYSESVFSQDAVSLPHDFFPSAGLSTFRRSHHASTKAHYTKAECQDDLSLLRGPRWQARSMPRLDPSSMHDGFPAGGVTKVNRMECHKAKKGGKHDDRTDPITHFKHDPDIGVKLEVKEHFVKRMGYEHGGALQHWTWAQDPKVVAELGCDARPESVWQKYQVGADGKRYYNVCGVEDLLPAATQNFFKCDLPPQKENVLKNDRQMLAYCIREGHPQRPVHSHWKSDNMWSVMQHEGYMIQMKSEEESRLRPSAHTQTSPRFREASWSEESEDEKFGRRGDVRWKRSDATWTSDPSPSGPSNRGLALSMTPRSFNRSSRTSRSLTPRSSLPASRSLTPRISTLDSTTAREYRQEPRSKLSPTPASLPIDQARSQVATSKHAASQGDAPRAVASRNSVAGLSMTPQIISRRAGGSTPLNLTPRGATPGSGRSDTRGLRKSASEAAFR